MSKLQFVQAGEADAGRLADIRVEAMRPSLEAAGRFDETRARARFLSTFERRDTQLIYFAEDLIGFTVIRNRSDHIYLDHLYFRPEHQGRGFGKEVVAMVQQRAADLALPVRLLALKTSPAGKFYERCGFRLSGSDEFDNHFEWWPK